MSGVLIIQCAVRGHFRRGVGGAGISRADTESPHTARLENERVWLWRTALGCYPLHLLRRHLPLGEAVSPRIARLLPPVGGSRKTVSAAAPPRHLRRGGEQFVFYKVVVIGALYCFYYLFAALAPTALELCSKPRWGSAPVPASPF